MRSEGRLASGVARVVSTGLRVGALVATLVGAREAAAAEPSPTALSFVRLPGAESCIAAAELGGRVEERLGRKVLVPASEATLSLEGRVERLRSGAFRATVSGSRRDGAPLGTRELVTRGADCRALDDDLVLVLALLVDPDAALGPREASPPSPEAPPAPPAAAPVVHERVVVREIVHAPAEPAAPWRVDAELAAAGAVGRVPGSALGAALAVRFGPRPLVTFEVGATILPAATLEVDGAPGRRVDLALADARLGYCPAVPLGGSGRVELGGCVGVRLGAIRTAGEGFAGAEPTTQGLADGAAGGRVSLGLVGPLRATLGATGLVPFVRHEVRASQGARELLLSRQPLFAGELTLGLALRFSP